MSGNNLGKIPLSRPVEKLKVFVVILIILSLPILSIYFLDLDFQRFVSRLSNFPFIFRQFLRPNPEILPEGLYQLYISVMMALASLALGAFVSLILSFLAAENTAPSKTLSVIIKSTVSVIRAVPGLVLILLIVAHMGLRNATAVTALTLSSMGYLTKAFTATIEEQPQSIIDTMRATGAKWFQIVVHGLLPNVLPSFVSWVSMRFEMSVAESISLGVIGVGGIGGLIMRSARNHRFSDVSMLILIIFVSMLVVEVFLTGVKKRVNM